MKKFTFTTLALFLSACAIGCSSDGINGLCRTGSLFPVVRNNRDIIYTPKNVPNNCDPCIPVQPQPCTPCDPVCNPCDSVNCVGPVTSGRIQPPTGG